jgi:uncharacterized protein (DUF697 family)
MKLPIKPGAVFGVVKELRAADERPILVAGILADELARELTAGGDPTAVRRGGSPEDVEALVYVVGDSITEQDERVLKSARRARVPIILLTAGREPLEDIPYVLATDIVRVEPGHGFPLDRLGEALARRLGEKATSLARRLPVLRGPIVEKLVESFSRKNGILGAAIFIPGADFPVLTLNQLRMVLRICAAHGLAVDRERAPEIVATVAAGLGFRTLARSLVGLVPVGGWAVKGAVAYTGTRAVGEASVRYCEARSNELPPGGSHRPEGHDDSPAARLRRAALKPLAKERTSQ